MVRTVSDDCGKIGASGIRAVIRAKGKERRNYVLSPLWSTTGYRFNAILFALRLSDGRRYATAGERRIDSAVSAYRRSEGPLSAPQGRKAGRVADANRCHTCSHIRRDVRLCPGETRKRLCFLCRALRYHL